MTGKLYLCATPIGNLGDITGRVIDCLKNADLIAAEDTRESLKLLTAFDIHTPLTSYHEFNKYDKAEKLLERLLAGESIALVTDAGTPSISDPGEVLVRRCQEAGIAVTSLPGPSAVVTALSLSGLPTRRFVFEGFLPSDHKKRREILSEVSREPRTMVFYEAPHHLRKTLSELSGCLGERELAVCRELTKKHEEVLHMTLPEAVRYFEANEPKGEFVLVVAGRPAGEERLERENRWEGISLEEQVKRYMEEGMDKKAAMKQAAADRGISRRDVYRALLDAKEAVFSEDSEERSRAE